MDRTQAPRKLSQSKKFAEIERISICGVKSRMGPIGLWLYSKSFAHAAAALPPPSAPYEPVRYYLACHAIELGLKAYLSLHGATMLELSESAYGHNLETILTAAEAKGIKEQLHVSDMLRIEICKAAIYYGGKVFEYPAIGEACIGYPSLPNLQVLLEFANQLVESLAQQCRAAQ